MRLRGGQCLKMTERLTAELARGVRGEGASRLGFLCLFFCCFLPLILLCGECSPTGLLGKENALGHCWHTFPGDEGN